MSNYRFSIGKEFLWNGRLYRVQRFIGSDIQKVTLEDVDSDCDIERPIQVLVDALFNGQLSFIQQTRVNRKKEISSIPNPEEMCVDLSDYPEPHRELARFRLSAITPLVLLKSSERTLQRVEEQVKNAIKPENNPRKFKISVRSIYRFIKDYERSGSDIRSLIPNYARCGGRGKSRLDLDLLNLIKAVIKEYVSTSRKEKEFTVDEVLSLVAARIEEENRFRCINEKLLLPSRTTISRLIESLDIKDRFEARHGSRNTRKMFHQDGKIKYPELPLERVEIDHTKTDLIVIDEDDNLPLGRLTLTYAIDTATRYPLGYYLGFEPPSYYAVMECLFNSIKPKNNTKETYGTEHEWIAYGIPNTLVTDQGREFVGKDLTDACELLGISLDIAPIKNPEFKACVERGYGTLNGLFHKLPGTTFSNFVERGDYDSTKEACISTLELEQALVIRVVDNYAELKHKGLDGGIPARRWEYALQTNFFPRLPENNELLRILLGRMDFRCINDYGIDFARIRYNCDDLAILRFRMKEEKVKIKYHPGDLSRIYAFDPFETRYIEVPALDQEYTNNLSLWKQKVILNYLRNNGEANDYAAQGRALLKIQGIVEKARDQQKKKTRSKTARWDHCGQPKSLITGTAVASNDKSFIGTNFKPVDPLTNGANEFTADTYPNSKETKDWEIVDTA